MKALLNANDVLSDIEFELIQGAISRDELGQSIQAVKQYQNKVRSEAISSIRSSGEVREIINRQFQINDMLITLLQETSAALRTTQLELRRVARMSNLATPAARVASKPAIEQDVDLLETTDLLAFDTLSDDSLWQPLTEVEKVQRAMQPEALQMESQIRSTNVPIIGAVVKRLRIALHHLVLFYVNRLVEKQVAVNQTYGDWILRTVQLCHDQQDQIDSLNAQLKALQNCLSEGDRSAPPSTDL
jgi:hypothetical protein